MYAVPTIVQANVTSRNVCLLRWPVANLSIHCRQIQQIIKIVYYKVAYIRYRQIQRTINVISQYDSRDVRKMKLPATGCGVPAPNLVPSGRCKQCGIKPVMEYICVK